MLLTAGRLVGTRDACCAVSDVVEGGTGPGRRISDSVVGTLPRVSKSTSFSLDGHSRAFIASEVASGRYHSDSDVVRAALRLLEGRQMRIEALRQPLIADENSGVSTSFDFDEFISRKRVGSPEASESSHPDKPKGRRSLRVRQAAAQTAVTASRKTGRPVDERVRRIAESE